MLLVQRVTDILNLKTHILIKRPHRFRDEFVKAHTLSTFKPPLADSNVKYLLWRSVRDRCMIRAFYIPNSEFRQIMHDNQAGGALLADKAYPLTP